MDNKYLVMIFGCVGVVLTIAAGLTIPPYLAMLAWNFAFVPWFGVAEVTYWTMFWANIFISLVLGSIRITFKG